MLECRHYGSKVLMIKASFHATGYGRECGKSKVMDRGICSSETNPCAAASVASWGSTTRARKTILIYIYIHIHIHILSYLNTSSTCCSQSSKQISSAPERNAGDPVPFSHLPYAALKV